LIPQTIDSFPLRLNAEEKNDASKPYQHNGFEALPNALTAIHLSF
jgi:hypothetical protein